MKICVFGLMLWAVSVSAAPFWDSDVWRDPERPFLYYGEEKKAAPNEKGGEKPAPKSLADMTTVEELKAERERRLNAAVMDPTDAKIASYLEVNSFVQMKAAAFSDAWRDALLRLPAYDWTARHPVVNSASVALSQERSEADAELVAGAGRTWGLLFLADDSRLSELMLPLVRRFAAGFGLELVEVAAHVSGTPTGFRTGMRPDAGTSAKAAGGVALFPALLLVNVRDRGLTKARPLATGVVSVEELLRRTARLIRKES